jgi:mRNA interferase RelE/StbE
MAITLTKWSLAFTEKASKKFNKLDNVAYCKIKNFIDHRLLQVDNPRLLGKPLPGNLKEFWRYRVGDLQHN